MAIEKDKYFSNIQLESYMLQMLLDNSTTDVTFVCGDGQISCHKIILASVSDFLKQILLDTGKEDAVIIVPSIHVHLLKKILMFLYSGVVTFEAWEGNQVLELFHLMEINVGERYETIFANEGVSHNHSTKLVVCPQIVNKEISDDEEDEIVMVNVEMNKYDSEEIDSINWPLPLSLCSAEIGNSIQEITSISDYNHCGMIMEEKLSTNYVTSNDRSGFECEDCQDYFLTKDYLDMHKTYGGCKHHKCTKCNKAFATSFQCKRHEITHTGIKPFTCKYCNKAFTRKENLQLHNRTMHVSQSNTRIPCPTCGRIFKRKDQLKKHLSVHTGLKPYTCYVCGKGLTRKIYLNQHIYNVHGIGKKEESEQTIEGKNNCFVEESKYPSDVYLETTVS